LSLTRTWHKPTDAVGLGLATIPLMHRVRYLSTLAATDRHTEEALKISAVRFFATR
jgi:hypothetical protein